MDPAVSTEQLICVSVDGEGEWCIAEGEWCMVKVSGLW